MRLQVTHRSDYSYEAPLRYGLQRLRLVPRDTDTQRVLDWAVDIEGAREEVRFLDQFGNDTRLLSLAPGEAVSITARGTLETFDRVGVVGPHRGFAPLWLFLATTALTTPGERVAELVAKAGEGETLARLHGLMDLVGAAVAFLPGSTGTATSAEDALKLGTGVCQDHAHVFIAAARSLGIPARYASGYLLMDHGAEQVASHAWAEAHVDGLGWVGFDAANQVCPDDRYVRLAIGRDYRDASPVSGIILGTVAERLEVHITVEQ